ncbi:NAD(P)-binding protein [Daedalea quercina L-15889]|uniref:NAD(P)-binding protein n=1 Tax=Daedalea quercina L-15889 TaxID=1314783 RepID=A0A165NRD5_9APHY|nr:NAD(P)-binding protein [Daedalea quercina L-15889]
MAAPALRHIALVTGAAQGIGRSIALRLAKDGLDVAVNDVPSKRQQLEELASEIKSKEGRQAAVVHADVTSEADVQAMTASAVGQLGGLDVMVANAGIGPIKDLLEVSVEEWDMVMRVNLRGVMRCYKYAALQMIQQGRGGRITGMSSIVGKKGYSRASAYAASKFGVRGLTQCAALELAKHNITVNACAPGIIKTPLSSGLFQRNQERGLAPGTTISELLGLPPQPLPLAEPEVVSSLVSYLAKPESYFITGQTISVDGGVVFD